jgi:hypothetical protein
VSRPEPLEAYAPDPEELKKRERGEKFGTGYNPEGALMDMGAQGSSSLFWGEGPATSRGRQA